MFRTYIKIHSTCYRISQRISCAGDRIIFLSSLNVQPYKLWNVDHLFRTYIKIHSTCHRISQHPPAQGAAQSYSLVNFIQRPAILAVECGSYIPYPHKNPLHLLQNISTHLLRRGRPNHILQSTQRPAILAVECGSYIPYLHKNLLHLLQNISTNLLRRGRP